MYFVIISVFATLGFFFALRDSGPTPYMILHTVLRIEEFVIAMCILILLFKKKPQRRDSSAPPPPQQSEQPNNATDGENIPLEPIQEIEQESDEELDEPSKSTSSKINLMM